MCVCVCVCACSVRVCVRVWCVQRRCECGLSVCVCARAHTHKHTNARAHYLRLCPRKRPIQLFSQHSSKRFTLRVQAQGEQLTASSESSCSYLAQLYTLIRVLCDRRSSKGVIGHQLGRPVSTITYRVFASLCTVFGGAPVITCTLYSCADAAF